MKQLAAGLLYCCAATAAAQSCRIEAPRLAFGRYDPAAPRATVTHAEILLNCTPGTRAGSGALRVGILLDGPAQRRLAGPSGMLRYELFQDAALSRLWWQGAPPALVVDSDGREGLEARVPVYARLAPGQWVGPGSYADQVAVRIEF